MSVSYTISEKFIWYKLEGNHTIDETFQGFKAGLEDPGFRKGLNILVDAHGSKEKRSRNELAALAEFFGSKVRLIGHRCALFINEKNPDQEGYEKFLATLSDRYQVDFFVFLTHEDAVQWLSEG